MYYTTQQHLCQVNSDISSVNHRKSFPESDAIERIWFYVNADLAELGKHCDIKNFEQFEQNMRLPKILWSVYKCIRILSRSGGPQLAFLYVYYNKY